MRDTGDMSVGLGMPSLPPPVLAPRRKTRQIQVGTVGVGSDSPVSVQSMTTTLTSDVNSTLQQIAELTAAGCDIVRVACPSQDDADALAGLMVGVGLASNLALDLSLSGLRSERGNLLRQQEIVINALKFAMGMPVGESLNLSDNVPKICSKVLLPDPDGPTIETTSPLLISRSTPFSTSTFP